MTVVNAAVQVGKPSRPPKRDTVSSSLRNQGTDFGGEGGRRRRDALGGSLPKA